MGAGGAETMLMKIYRAINKEKYQMDFLVFDQRKGFYDDEIIANGGRMFYMPSLREKPLLSLRYLYCVVKKYKYEHVLLSSEWSLHIILLFVAKMAGAKRLAVRSTNTNTGRGVASNILHQFFKLFFSDKYIKLAPSTEAAQFMYGMNCLKKNNMYILPNGLDLKVFQFDKNKRKYKRDEIGVGVNEYLVGHIGRFEFQKNHRLIIEIFREIKKQKSTAKLLLIGKGGLLVEIKKLLTMYGLIDSVIFLDDRKDIPDLLMAMDVMLFPSYYEGMPNVVVEAQATGLQCVVSKSVTKECKLTDLVSFVSLDQPLKSWTFSVFRKSNIDRYSYNQLLKKRGYEIKDVSTNFIKYIFG